MKLAMSATVPRFSGPPLPSPPVPGALVLAQPRSCAPNPAVKGVPRFKPWPGIAVQFTPSVRPASEHWEGLMPLLMGVEPGKLRYFAAILPAGAKASKAAVSYHPFEGGTDLGVRTVS